MQAFVRLSPPLPLLPRPIRHPRFLCTNTNPLPHVTAPPSLSSIRNFLLLSDLHVKRETAATCVQVLQYAHQQALQRNAAILFLGDFWHARGALPVEPLNKILTELQTWSVPVVMIPGNHDLITRSGNGVSLVPLATTLGKERCMLITKPSVFMGALFLPYTHDDVKLREALEMGSRENVQAVFCHTTVAGARLADRVVAKGGIVEGDFPRGVWVYSGHLHRPHMVGERIRYVGSPYQVSRGEMGQEKGLVVVDRLRGWEVVEKIPIRLGPRYWAVGAEVGEGLLNSVRRGDRVTVEIRRGEEVHIKELVGRLRKEGARVEVKVIGEGIVGGNNSEGLDPFVPPEPRISGGKLSNLGMFREYGELKNLGPRVSEMGRDILADVGGKYPTMQASMSGKDVVIEWEEVSLRGFGSFLETVTYPLRKRGLVLLTGRYCDEEGAVTGKTNGTGKTTLAMSALWALTGRTDARPDGSVEKGVSLEMVHDDAMDCEVKVKLLLRGDRVVSEVQDMLTAEERVQARLINGGGGRDGLDVVVTRTSSRPVASSKSRSYRQGLHLKVNGVDLTCLEVRETQSRIDRLVNGTLLPHTVFFGQHMGAGRGLVDSTDRTLKEHLALIFPLDIWKEARKTARDRVIKLQETLLTSEATLEAGHAVGLRLTTSLAACREQRDDYESKRNRKIARLEESIHGYLASYSRWEQDSIAYSENFAIDSADLSRVIDDCTSLLRFLEDKSGDNLDISGADTAASLARAVASLESAEDLSRRVKSLVNKSEEWEVEKSKALKAINSFISDLQKELGFMESLAVLNKTWHAALGQLYECEERLDDLAKINIQQGEAAHTAVFTKDLQQVLSMRQRLSALEEDRFCLQASLNEINDRLSQSQELSLVSRDWLLKKPGGSISSAVACETCLRPFDGELFIEARTKLEKEATSVQNAIVALEEKRSNELQEYESAVNTLRGKIDAERAKLLEKKTTLNAKFNYVRRARDSRSGVLREIQDFRTKGQRRANEANLYLNELSEIVPAVRGNTEGLSVSHREALRLVSERVSKCQQNLKDAERKHRKVMANLKSKELDRVARATKRSSLQAHIDDLIQLQSRCRVLENEKQSLQSETNPFQESLRMLTEQWETEKEKVEKKEREFSSLSDTVETLKSLDVAFGPRGVPSFVLEEGLMWLEKVTSQYLQKLSAGELMLQIRAFSDYKSSNRADGDNKEVISKRVFILNPSQPSKTRERSLRQLSGGQRRRCSLAFALAFADLAHERAGFQSSLIVMDEILQSLDEDGRCRVSRVLPDLMGEGYAARDTVIVVAQDEAPEIAGFAHGGVDVVVRDGEQSTVLLDGRGHTHKGN